MPTPDFDREYERLRAELAASERLRINAIETAKLLDEEKASLTAELAAERERAEKIQQKADDEFATMSKQLNTFLCAGAKIKAERDALRAAAESVVDAYRDKGRATAALVGQCIEDLDAALALGGGDADV